MREFKSSPSHSLENLNQIVQNILNEQNYKEPEIN